MPTPRAGGRWHSNCRAGCAHESGPDHRRTRSRSSSLAPDHSQSEPAHRSARSPDVHPRPTAPTAAREAHISAIVNAISRQIQPDRRGSRSPAVSDAHPDGERRSQRRASRRRDCANRKVGPGRLRSARERRDHDQQQQQRGHGDTVHGPGEVHGVGDPGCRGNGANTVRGEHPRAEHRTDENPGDHSSALATGSRSSIRRTLSDQTSNSASRYRRPMTHRPPHAPAGSIHRRVRHRPGCRTDQPQLRRWGRCQVEVVMSGDANRVE